MHHIGEHCVQVSSNSDKNCRRRSTLKKTMHFTEKKRDVTIPLSGLVSEIFSPKVATMIIPDDVISDVVRPKSTIREDHIDRLYRGTFC